MTERAERYRFLRRSMRANAIFSLVSGLTILVTARPLSDVLAPATPLTLRLLACALLLYTLSLLRSASRPEIGRSEAWAAVILDSLWVAGSFVLIVSGLLTTAGSWIVGLVADVVMLFALLQYLGLRRARRTMTIPLFALSYLVLGLSIPAPWNSLACQDLPGSMCRVLRP